MATNFPTSLDNLSNPAGSDPVNNPSHAVQHANVNDAIEALETKVGVNNSAVTTSLDYRVKQLETNPTYTNEMAQDAVAAALAAGTHTNITINYNDTGNSISISAAAGYTNEEAVDAVAAALTAGSGISISYNDPANTITISVDSTIATKTYVDTAITSLGNTAATTYVPQSDVGNIDGVASLDGTGKVPDSQIPAGIARDSEVTSAISTEVTNRNSAISTAINNLINSAPGTLDTLGEIATQLAADESAAAALTTVVNGKVSKAGGDIIQSSLSTVIPLVVKGAASQTANLQEWQDSAGNLLGRITSNGVTSFYGGSNIFPGDVRAGTSSYLTAALSVASRVATESGLVVRGFASQTVNLQEWQNSSGTVLANVDSAGFVNGSAYRQIGGNSNGFGIGTISSVLTAFGSGGNATVVPVVVRGASGQTANLTEWQNSAGTVLASVDAYGTLLSNWKAYIQSGASYLVPITVRAAASQSANLQEWQNSAGTVLAFIRSDGFARLDQGLQFGTMYSYAGAWSVDGGNSFKITQSSAAYSPLIVKGAASQTANLQEWQNSAGTVLASISPTGKLTSAVDAEINGYKIGKGAATTGTSNIAFGLNALNSNTTGSGNFAIGIGVLQANTTGGGNFALGSNSLINSTTGDLNMALGNGVLYNNTTGYYNVGIGYNALVSNTTGRENMAIGISALGSLTTGALNTAVGQGAGYSTTTGNSNVFIGYAAGGAETGSNKLYIANTSTATPLIGGDFSAKTLTVAGNTTITSQATGTVGLVVKGVASQTADLQQWQDSSGNVLAKIDLNGRMTADHFKASVLWNNVIVNYGDNGPYFNMTSTNVLLQNRNTTSNVLFTIKGMASQTGDLQQWQNSAGTVIANIGSAGDMTANGSIYTNNAFFGGGASYYNATINIRPQQTSYKGIVIQARASQTGNLQEWQDSSGTALSKVDSTGAMFTITPADSTNNTQVATTAYVKSNIANLVSSAPATLDTLNELATALGNDANFSTTVTNSIALKAPLASPTFTGTVSGITKTMVGLGSVDNTADIAKPISTATQTALDLKAALASPTFTGTPLAPTATTGTNTTQIATTAFVKTAIDTSVQPGAVYQTSAPSSPAVGQIWIDSDDDVTTFDSNIIRRKAITATAGQTVFTADLPFIDGFEQIFMNGLLLVKTTDYATSGGNTVTLTSGAAASDVIEIVSVTGANSVTTYTQAEVDTLIANNKAVSPQAISANTTLVKKKRYYVTSASALTLTLPASPTLDDEIQIVDASGNASTYNITVARNGSLINGGTGNLIIDTNGGWYTLIYTGSTYGWKVG